ncbi:MAG: FliM/FliN family flagellar motor C-terminal domain-containing protein [Planctomycetota bacterium]
MNLRVPPRAAEPRTSESPAGLDPILGALQDVRLPLIAILAAKTMPLSAVLDLDVGSVIVFPKHNADPITLMVNNVPVGSGKTIKVGDHFGLHLRSYSQAAVLRAALA